MRTATGLAVAALGAILAFAVKGHLSFINLQLAGWVIFLAGVVGMIIPRRGYGWLHRQLVVRPGPGGMPGQPAQLTEERGVVMDDPNSSYPVIPDETEVVDEYVERDE
jgi:hypothetical protein